MTRRSGVGMKVILTVAICLFAVYCLYSYHEVHTRLKRSDEKAERLKQQHDSLSAQLQGNIRVNIRFALHLVTWCDVKFAWVTGSSWQCLFQNASDNYSTTNNAPPLLCSATSIYLQMGDKKSRELPSMNSCPRSLQNFSFCQLTKETKQLEIPS